LKYDETKGRFDCVSVTCPPEEQYLHYYGGSEYLCLSDCKDSDGLKTNERDNEYGK
jgi:hypothetical protein